MKRDCTIYEPKTKAVCTFVFTYCKVPKFSDAGKLCCNLPKIETKRPNLKVFCQKGENGKASSENPDWYALFAQTYLSENLGSLRYIRKMGSLMTLAHI